MVRGFAYDERRPFAAGQRRGADLLARPAAVVRAACGGEVTHAGRVPRRGLGVSVRCRGLTATHLGLGSLAVRRGARVRAGIRLGRAGPAGVVRLGARVTARRWGWVDPLALVGEPPHRGAPLGPAPPRTAPRPGPLPVAWPGPAARAAPAARAEGAARPAPVIAWVGAGLLAAGLPLGGVLRARRVRRRDRREVAVAARPVALLGTFDRR